jgi:hypothetical protein
MKYLFSIYIITIFSFNLAFSNDAGQIMTYSFDDATNLTIEGTSNINSFDCKCKDKFPKSSIRVFFDNSRTIRFAKGRLLMKSAKLDCNNSRMNRDLCEALKSEEYPNIVIDLLDAKMGPEDIIKADEWIRIKASVVLTITNISKMLVLDVKVKRVALNKMRFTSSQDILLTDFGITPPTALMGLIKVNNKVKINFDIIALIDEGNNFN